MKKTGANKPITLVTVGELRAWLGLESDRRVQQLADEGVVVKAGRSQYDLKASVTGYCHYQRQARKVSGLAAKQEQSLDIRNQREMMEVLHDMGEYVLKSSIAHSLTPIWKTLQAALRSVPSTTARENLNICKEYHQAALNGEIQDQEYLAIFRDRDLRLYDDAMKTTVDSLRERFGMK